MRPTEFDQRNAVLGGGPAERFGTDNDVSNLMVYRGGGELVDPETEDMTLSEIEAISWQELPEAEPAWGRHP